MYPMKLPRTAGTRQSLGTDFPYALFLSVEILVFLEFGGYSGNRRNKNGRYSSPLVDYVYTTGYSVINQINEKEMFCYEKNKRAYISITNVLYNRW